MIAWVRRTTAPIPRTAGSWLVGILIVVCVAALFAFLGYRIGYLTLWRDLRSIGWGLAPIVGLEFAINLITTIGWWCAFPRQARRRSLGRLFLVRLSGSALNQTILGAPLSGEPVKVMLLQGRFPATVTIAAIMSAKLAESLARAFFIMWVLLSAWGLLNLDRLTVHRLAAGFTVTAVAVGAFMALQIRGFAGLTTSALRRLHHLSGPIARIEKALSLVDQHLRELYSSRPLDFAASVALNLAALTVGVVQVWLLMGWLGAGRDWPVAGVIEAFSVLLNFVLFFMPGSLGVQEGGKLLIFSALGLPVSVGFSLGVAFRLNSLAIVASGLAVLPFLKRRRAPDAPRDGISQLNARRCADGC